MKRSLLFAACLLIACNEAPKDNAAEKPQANKTTTQTVGNISWERPNGWVQETPTSSMRQAQFRLPHAESDSEDASIVVFYFQGEGGGVNANIQRWISQFKAPDGNVTREVVQGEKIEVNGLPQTIVDVTGTYLVKIRPMATAVTEEPGFRMLAAVVETAAGPWFVKFVGPERTVAQWEASFRRFMASFKAAS